MSPCREPLRQYLFGTLLPTAPPVWPDDDADLFRLGMDSMRVMQLLAFIEAHFGVYLPDEEISSERLQCVRTLLEWLERYRPGRGAP
jgi:acyl carrier protein